ncbi:hypothetical protein [Methanococcoides sp. LMO-2]|uniref:ATP-binding protein n=1 Tax=Methanococcoides cohabitans TaxID=3136559 RepID=A0ABU9KRX0_9EURY
MHEKVGPKMNKHQSPFQYNRWESDTEHLIWIPERLSEWEKKRSIYISGSRGTGKTTLLRAFEWKQRLHNESLKSQLDKHPFSNRYIGVYLSMPDFITNHFRNWPPKENHMDDETWEEEKARVYSLYIEYQILQLFVAAIKDLRGNQILNFTPNEEEDCVQKILEERPEIKHFLVSDKDVIRLNDLKICFKLMHEKIRLYAIKNVQLPYEEMYPVLQMGKMLDEIADILLNLCSQSDDYNDGDDTKLNSWTLKVCLDQVESPENYQLRAINTMVARLSGSNVSFAIATVKKNMDIISTYIPNHPLTDADRMHYDLDEIYRKEPGKFKEFISNVSELRFRKYTGKDDISVDLPYILGEWDINTLLYPLINKSENKNAKELLKRAKLNMGNKFFEFDRKDLPLDQLIDDGLCEKTEISEAQEILIPPIFQTYLVEKLNLNIDDSKATNYEIRAFKSSTVRKEMVVAMLCLCKEYGLPVPYAGYNMVVDMSDQCIRDFLLQMHHIYVVQAKSPEEFVQKPVNIRKQFKALKNASNARYDGIKNDVSYEIGQLIYSIGKITAEVQSAYNDSSSFKRDEKGRFYINYALIKSNKDKERLKRILKLARDSFCIKVLEESQESIVFRLHNLFAPKFSFSYRGSYSNVKISGEDLLYLCITDNEKDVNSKIDKVTSKLIKTGQNMTLEMWGLDNAN